MAGSPGTQRHSAPDTNGPDLENLPALGIFGKTSNSNPEVNSPPFIGKLGGNGTALARCPPNEAFLEKVPDAAPLMSLADVFNLKPFLTIGLWKSALMEGIGKKYGTACWEIRTNMQCRIVDDCMAHHLC